MSNPKFVRNEVTYITNEIDYDKLAEAIVRANQKINDTTIEEKTEPKVKISFEKKLLLFIKSVWLIIIGKK